MRPLTVTDEDDDLYMTGFRLGEASLFISVAMSLAVFKISKAVVDGVEVAPEVDVTSGTVS